MNKDHKEGEEAFISFLRGNVFGCCRSGKEPEKLTEEKCVIPTTMEEVPTTTNYPKG